MANPQKEHGYTPIANEIMDALIRVPIGLSNAQVLYAILRKTYGWNKKKDKISISQLMEMTGCSRRTIIYAMQNLEAKRMIIIKRKRGRGNINEINEITFNKNHTQWVVQEKSKQYRKALKTRKEYYKKSKQKVVQEIKVVQEMEKEGVFLAPTKDTTTKDIYISEFKFLKKVPLPTNIFLTDRMKEYVKKQGCENNGHAEYIFEGFCNYYNRKGTKWQDWTLTFYDWVRNDKKNYNPDKYKKIITGKEAMEWEGS